MTVDYTNAQNQYDLSRAMFAQNLKPVQGAGPLDTLARVLAANFNSKNMRGAQHGMKLAETNQLNAQKMDLAKALGAFREDTPYQPSPDELMPGEQPIQGLSMEGTGNNRQAMVESLMGSSTPGLQSAGLGAMLAQPKETKPSTLVDQLTQMGLTPGTREWQEMATKLSTMSKAPVVNNDLRNMGGLKPGEEWVYDDQGRIKGVRVVPGSSLDRENKAREEETRLAQEQSSLDAATTDLKKDEFLGQIDKALENNTFWTTGMVGKVLSFWSSSDARYQEKLLERIQGEVALDRLAQAQAASKTGGVFGSLQKAELDLLKNSLEALEVGMSGDRMQEGLLGIKEHRLKWDGYQELWNDPEWTGLALKESERMAKFGDYVPERDGVEILNSEGKIIGYYR